MPSPHGLDVARLTRYLEAHLPGFTGPIDVEKFPQGQSNPTFRLVTPGGRLVLRRKPPGQLLKSAHAIEREYRVLGALAATDVPAPRVRHLCTDDTVIGSWFYVMDYVDGRVFFDPALPELTAAERTRAYHEAVSMLARIHSIDVDAAGLADFGRPGNYFERQVSRWTKQYEASKTTEIAAMDTLIEWLPAHIPADDGRVALIHGDYRLDNVMFARDRLDVVAVLDWELSTLGHPLADLAYFSMQRRMARDFYIRGLASLDLDSLGIPDERTLLESYCELTDIENIDAWPFYLACSFFRLAAICQGVQKRALDGNASSEHALEVGAMTEPLAELGVDAAMQHA
jgi:aminoglycoside phosphotransferase (APT) family kinase protein